MCSYDITSENPRSRACFKCNCTDKTANSRQENATVCLNPKLDVRKQPEINYSIVSLCDLSTGDASNLNLRSLFGDNPTCEVSLSSGSLF